MCEVWEHLPKVADEICFYRGCQAQSINHPTACYHLNTGSQFGGDPAVGAWTTYGLGSENANLPAFVVLPEAAYPQGGAANWSNGFLPAYYQGTALRASGSPILDLRPPPYVTDQQQRANLALLGRLNQADRERHPHHDELTARMQAYELAFRMQAQVPTLVDLNRETRATLDAYGIGKPETDGFGRRCLLARRLVEAGVRFVQLYASGWDSHDYLERSHRARMRAVDQPIAGLLTDLRERGLLDETLVVWGGEFGRTPMVEDNPTLGRSRGRDHHPQAFSLWMAGGGIKAGLTYGATDEMGFHVAENPVHIHDVQATMLHCLGLDHERLTYEFQGRRFRLTDVHGKVVTPILA
jgi:hypothetical protein